MSLAIHPCQAYKFDVTREASYGGAEGLHKTLFLCLAIGYRIRSSLNRTSLLIRHRVATNETWERSNDG
jgi:hypothetical protein